MPQAEFTMPSGATVVIKDGSPEEVAKTLQLLEESLSPTTPAKKKKKKSKKQPKREKIHIKARIRELKEAGFFAEAKSLPEINEAIRLRWAYILTSNQISPKLTQLRRDGELDRDGVPGKYKYFEPS